MSNLKDYISEAISSGRSRSNRHDLDRNTKFKDFLDLLDRLGYEFDGDRNGHYMHEMYSVSTLISKLTKYNDKIKRYTVQDMKSSGFFRVVLYNGNRTGSSWPYNCDVMKVDFEKSSGRMDAADIELFKKDGDRYLDSEDSSVTTLSEYIDE